MLRMKKLLFAVTLCAVTIGVFPSTCYGNSAEPPSIVIIVPDAPDDLKILVKSNNTYIETKRTDNIIETLYSFYSIDLNTAMDYTIKVNTGGKTFEVLLKEPANTYRDILTLNLNSQTLTPGKSLKRSFF